MRKKIAKNKNIILASLIGVSLSFANLSLAQWDPRNLDPTGLPSQTLFNIIANVMDWLLIAVGFAGVIGFAIAGILYLTSAGNDDQIKKAKTAMTYSILGVVVALAGLVALRAADSILNASRRF